MEELVKEWLENHLIDDTLEEIITCVAEMLENSAVIRERIFREVEKEYHREDVMTMAEELGHENIDDDTIDELVAYYEDYLGNDDGWWYACREAFCEILDDEED